MDAGTPKMIAQSSLFQGLSDADIASVAKLATIVKAKTGECLVEENAKGEDFFVLVRGRIDIHVSMPDGSESESLAQLKEGDSVGESVLLGRLRRMASAVARDEVEALRWDVTTLGKFFDANPHAGFLVMRNLARILLERLMATNMLLRNTFNRVVDMI